jgi:signal peptidase II
MSKSLRVQAASWLCSVLILDQYTKHLARALPQAIDLGPLMLTYTENRGAFLSLGANLPEGVRAWLFNGVVSLGLIALAVYLFKNPEMPLTLVLAGGAGNLIDRLRFDGRVTDFLYLHAGPLHTGVFNVADMAITAGAVWMGVRALLDRSSTESGAPKEGSPTGE